MYINKLQRLARRLLSIYGKFQLVFFLLFLFFVLKCTSLASENENDSFKKGYALFKEDKYSESIPYLNEWLDICRKQHGSISDQTAVALYSLSSAYYLLGDYENAIKLRKEILDIRLKINGRFSDHTAQALSSLGDAYNRIGDVRSSAKFLEEALEVRLKINGKSDQKTITLIGWLVKDYIYLGFFDKALELALSRIKLSESFLGKNHPQTADALIDTAYIYDQLNYPDKAIPLLEKAISIINLKSGKNHFTVGYALRDLAFVYRGIGNDEKAVELMQNSLKIAEINGNEEDISAMLNNLAIVFISLGDSQKADAYLDRSSQFYKTKFGELHANLAPIYRNKAKIKKENQDYDAAIKILKDALHIRESSMGVSSISCSGDLSSIADCYYSQGNIDLSIKYYLDSVDENRFVFDNKNMLEPMFIGLSTCYYKKSDLQNSIYYTNKCIDILYDKISNILYLDEKSRLNWQKEQSFYFDAATILPAEKIAELLIRFKGIILESLAEDRALASASESDKNGSKSLIRIRSLQNQISRISLEQSQEAEVNKLQDEIARLQRELTAKYLGRDRQRSSANITMADVTPALINGCVLVDFIQFEDSKLKGDEAICLGAIITGEDNKPVFVRIDEGNAINRSINSLRAAINQGNSIEVEAQTKFLSEKLWAPIAAKIPEGTKRLFLCPDADLNFLSFASLLESDGRFVAEKYPITYIGSARDLAKKPSSEISKSIALIANPQFDATAKNAKTTDLLAMRSAEADVFGSIALPPLPGTEAEAASLQALASENGWQTKSYLGSDATETSVRNTKKPGVLHLATHGFYLNSFTPPAPEGSRGMSVVGVKETAEDKKKKDKGVDPMRASGVAFTGAQQTLTSWSQKKAPNPETDGVLTAEEVGALRLDGTWLVTLSACETGVGEARSGEGVFGLRRAFMIAGAENLLMTLWPVADETTAKIMADFYKEAFATGDAPGSLAKVQRDWLVKLRQERGLLAAVREAGPFAMVAMTAPSVKTFETNQN